MAILVVLQS